jgi:uncharacterized peroxidase-related enzyme
MSRLAALSRGQCAAEFDALFALTEEVMGFVPNSMMIMARDRDLLAAFAQLAGVIMVRPGGLDRGTRTLVMLAASLTAGCRYCSAHSASLGARHLPAAKIAAIWNYEDSPLFHEGERVAMRFAQSAAQIPNAVTDDDFAALRRFFNEDQILEIVAIIAFMGFLNRWNDTLATPLEAAPLAFAERHLAPGGWTAGKHLAGGDIEAPPPRRRPLRARVVMWMLRHWGPKPN